MLFLFQKYCYEFSCLSDRHDDCQSPQTLDEIIKEGRADLCPMTEKGCYVGFQSSKIMLKIKFD